jgi:ABC-type bacteriocin/lantibiotic exporter with double-glycine peptidase domain
MCGIKISATLRLEFLRALFKQPISALDEIDMGKPATTITTSANTIQAGISDKLAGFVQSLSLLISAYAIAFRYSWSLTLIGTSALVFMIMVYGTVVPFYIKFQKRMELADEKASAIAAESFGTIRTIVACGAEGRLAERYQAWVAESRKRGLRIAPLLGVQLFPSGFALYSNMALCFWFGIRQYAAGNLSDAGPVVT